MSDRVTAGMLGVLQSRTLALISVLMDEHLVSTSWRQSRILAGRELLASLEEVLPEDLKGPRSPASDNLLYYLGWLRGVLESSPDLVRLYREKPELINAPAHSLYIRLRYMLT